MSGNVWHDSGEAQRWDLPDLDAETAVTEEAVRREDEKLHTAGELDALQREAYREGFERGHSDGLRTGAAAAQDQLRRLQAMIDALADPMRRLDLAVERTLVSLVCTICERILHGAVSDPEGVLQLVQDAVAALGDTDSQIRVHLNPEDRRLLEALLQETALPMRWTLLDDPELGRGDLRVGTDVSEVDARLHERLQRLEAEMLGEM